jgi:short-subunit dehydrogenase
MLPAPARPLAVITGASSGIGAAFARQLAPRYDLLLIARRERKLYELAREISPSSGAKIDVLAADLSTDQGVTALASRLAVETQFALLINNAGFGTKGLLWESPIEPQLEMHRLHVTATLRLCDVALRLLVPKRRGGIINVASVASFVRGAGSTGYAATKSWMTAFTEGLALELRSRKSPVTVQALCPGFTYSQFHDVADIPRESRAPKALWLTADEVVSRSLSDYAAGKLYSVPGWRYRLIVFFVTKLPWRMRVGLESRRVEPDRRADQPPRA